MNACTVQQGTNTVAAQFMGEIPEPEEALRMALNALTGAGVDPHGLNELLADDPEEGGGQITITG